jgi:hypothetical protein
MKSFRLFKTLDPGCEQLNPMGHLNDTITDENLKTFEAWKEYDDAQDNFCEPDGTAFEFAT